MSRERADGKGRGASTQDFEEKTAAPPQSTDTTARCRLHHLKQRWGVMVEDWRKVELVQVRSMDEIETWSKESGTGEDAWFVLREKRKA